MPSRRRSSRYEVIFEADQKRAKILDLEQKAANPEFWSRQEVAQEVLQARRRLERDVELDKRLVTDLADMRALTELAEEGEDVLEDLKKEIHRLEQETQHVEIQVLLAG